MRSHNGLDGVHRQPPFSRILVSVLVVSWRVQDGDADSAVRINWAEEGRRVSAGQPNALLMKKVLERV
jgi:hypothetical protein